jgi:DNA-binding MarR family transcriptional regulator
MGPSRTDHDGNGGNGGNGGGAAAAARTDGDGAADGDGATNGADIFTRLHLLRDFEKQGLTDLRTLEDFAIVCAIGLHQERRRPLSLKDLYLLDISSHATITRRLNRLRSLGLVDAIRDDLDRRSVRLHLSGKMQAACASYDRLLAPAPLALSLGGLRADGAPIENQPGRHSVQAPLPRRMP